MRRIIAAIILMVTGIAAHDAAAFVREPGPDVRLDSAFSKGERAMDRGDCTEGIKHYMEAADLSHQQRAHEMECLSLYNLGVAYFSLYRNGEALDYFRKAYQICMEHNLGPKQEVMILNGLAGVFFEQQEYDKARKLVEKAYSLAVKNGITSQMETLTADIALICNKEGRYDEAERFISISDGYIADSDLRTKGRNMTILAETYFSQGKYEKVEILANKILANEQASDADKSLAMTYLISIHTDRGEYRLAYPYVEGAAAMSSISNKSYIFDILSTLYEKAGDYPKALQMTDSVILYQDSVSKINNRRLLEGANTQLEIMKYKADMESRIAELHERYLIWWFVAIVSVLILIITIVVINRQKMKIHLRQQLTETALEKEQKENLLNQERIRETELIATHQKEMMQKEIELKGRELAATAMFVTSRNELIEDIAKKLEEINNRHNIAEIGSLGISLRQQLRTSADQDNMVVNFEAADPDFARRVLERHPALLDSDVRFLSYVRMNMQTKDIAALLNITPDSCKRRKIRLSKKLGLETSSDLYSHILGI